MNDITGGFDLRKEIDAEINEEMSKEVREVLKDAVIICRKTAAMRDVWIERRTQEKTELADIEAKLFEAAAKGDMRTIKMLKGAIIEISHTKDLSKYHQKFGRSKIEAMTANFSLDDEDY